MNFSNLLRMNYQYITFSLMGLLIVFMGLFFISIFIMILPKVLSLIDGNKEYIIKKINDKKNIYKENRSEVLAAITIALALHENKELRQVGVNFQKDMVEHSIWGISGRIHQLSRRNPLTIRRGIIDENISFKN